MNCENCQSYILYKKKVSHATECPCKGKTMVCGECGKSTCEEEIMINFGVCDECMNRWLKEDGLI